MRNGSAGFLAINLPTLSAVAVAAESLMNRRRVVDLFILALKFCHSERSRGISYSKSKNNERCLDPFDFAQGKTSARNDKTLEWQPAKHYASSSRALVGCNRDEFAFAG